MKLYPGRGCFSDLPGDGIVVSPHLQPLNDSGTQACVGLDDGVCSGLFAVEQGLRQECVLVPLLSNICFAAVINVVKTRLIADKDTMDSVVKVMMKMGEGGRGEQQLDSLLWQRHRMV